MGGGAGFKFFREIEQGIGGGDGENFCEIER